MKFNPADFYWCKYDSDRATNITYKNKTLRIAKGMILGVCELRGQMDEIVFLDESSFRLPRAECDKLMTKVKAYRGKVVFLSEKAAKPAKSDKPKVKPAKIQPVVVKLQISESDASKEVKTLLLKSGIRLSDLKSGGPVARAKQVLRIGKFLKDDAQGIRVLNYLKSKFSADPRFVAELEKVQFKQTAIKVQPVEPPKKPMRTILAPTHKLRLQDIDFPESSDMADTDIPQEYLDRADSSEQKRGQTKVFIHVDTCAFSKKE